MFKFSVKMSVLPPEAIRNHHPLYNESEIKFDFENCSLNDAIDCALKHQKYNAFVKRNKIREKVYIYYTDIDGKWHYYNNV